MTKFKVGQRVHFDGDENDLGTVTQMDSKPHSEGTWYEVRWDNSERDSCHSEDELVAVLQPIVTEVWIIATDWYEDRKVVAVASSKDEADRLVGALAAEASYRLDESDVNIFGPYKLNEINVGKYGPDWVF